MWAKYATPPSAPAAFEVEAAEQHLLHEPEAEHHQRRQLDEREEEDDEDQRHHAGAREQQRCSRRARPRSRPTRRPSGPSSRVRSRPAARSPPARRAGRRAGLHAAHRVLDVVAEDPQEQHVAAEVQQPAVHEHRGERASATSAPRRRAALRLADLLAGVGDLVRDHRVVDEVAYVVLAVGLPSDSPPCCQKK